MEEKEQEFKMVEGVRNIHVAQIDQVNKTFLTPQKIRGLSEIKVEKEYKEGTAIGDMEVQLEKKKLKQLNVTVTANELPPSVEAMLQGMTYEEGVLITGANDNQKPVALLYEEVWSDGSSTFNAIYNIKLSKDAKEGKGNGDNIDFQTISLSGTGLKSDIADAFMGEFDSSANEDKRKYFFQAVQLPQKSKAAVIPKEDVSYDTSNEIKSISQSGVSYNTETKKFTNIPLNITEFTFTDGTDNKKASKSQSGEWSFATV